MIVKGNSSHTAERRKTLLELLCLRRYDTCDNLADELCVSRDTIRRDIAALMYLYPIETVRGHGGGVKVADGFYLHRNFESLTAQQCDVLKKVSASLDGNDRAVLDSILAKFAP